MVDRPRIAGIYVLFTLVGIRGPVVVGGPPTGRAPPTWPRRSERLQVCAVQRRPKRNAKIRDGAGAVCRKMPETPCGEFYRSGRPGSGATGHEAVAKEALAAGGVGAVDADGGIEAESAGALPGEHVVDRVLLGEAAAVEEAEHAALEERR